MPVHFHCQFGWHIRSVHRESVPVLLSVHVIEKKRNSGDYSTKVPPLPIPNREVKLRHADGTAQVGE